MLRRFEAYGFAAHATPDEQAELTRVLRDVGRHVPEVTDSAVGRNRSSARIDLVWEHAYAGPDAYATYMRHPFHICVLDRHLLPESPECITAPRRELGLGLFGYEVDGAPFRATAGVRRIVAMRTADGAPTAEVDGFLASLDERAKADARVSVVAVNSMGLEWFPHGWTHVWEQVFPDEDAMSASIDDERARLASGPVTEWVDLWYEIESDPDPGVGQGSTPSVEAASVDDAGAGRASVENAAAGPAVVVVDDVDVAESDVARYVEAFERWYLPGARRRGMELVACWQTPAGIGEVVTVTTAFAVGTWADWERMRNAAVGDPAVGEWIAARRAVMRAGRRRFVTEPGGAPAG